MAQRHFTTNNGQFEKLLFEALKFPKTKDILLGEKKKAQFLNDNKAIIYSKKRLILKLHWLI